jgi:hypothetical protein
MSVSPAKQKKLKIIIKFRNKILESSRLNPATMIFTTHPPLLAPPNPQE